MRWPVHKAHRALRGLHAHAPATAQLPAEKFHPHFLKSITHQHPAFAQPLDQRPAKVSHIQVRIALPTCPGRRSISRVRGRQFLPEFCEISKPPDLGRTSKLSRTFPLTRTSADTDRQDGYLSGLSAQARRYRCQAGVSFCSSSFLSGEMDLLR